MLLPLALVIVGGIVLTVGDLFMKKWVVSGGFNLYAAGLAIYLIGMMFLAQSFKYRNIGVASIMLVIFNITTLSLVSWFYFREKLSLLEIGGLILGIVAVCMMELGKEA